MATKKPERLKRVHMEVITEHIRLLRMVADDTLDAKQTVKAERGRVLYNPFGFKSEAPDPGGARREALLKLWPLQSTVVKVSLEEDALLVYTANI